MARKKTDDLFPKTQWTMIVRLAPNNPGAMDKLVRLYSDPLRIYISSILNRRGRSHEEVSEFLQGFFRHMLEKNVVGKADPLKGLFRQWLMKCAHNFVVEELEKRVPVPLEPGSAMFDRNDNSEDDSEHQANVAFANQSLFLVAEVIKEDYVGTNLEWKWIAFEERKLRPSQFNSERTPVEDLMARYGIQSREQIDNAVADVVKIVKKKLRTLVENLADDPAMVDEEVQFLLGLLQPGKPRSRNDTNDAAQIPQ